MKEIKRRQKEGKITQKESIIVKKTKTERYKKKTESERVEKNIKGKDKGRYRKGFQSNGEVCKHGRMQNIEPGDTVTGNIEGMHYVKL